VRQLSTDPLARLGGAGDQRQGRDMTRASDAVGAYGERVAARILADAGMRIIDRNWRCRTGEIDLVALDGATVVFCEVKTRRSGRFGEPVNAVVPGKARRLRRLAAEWLGAAGVRADEVRFDVVSVLAPLRGAAEVEHLRGVL
jgi:putative endonuclease